MKKENKVKETKNKVVKNKKDVKGKSKDFLKRTVVLVLIFGMLVSTFSYLIYAMQSVM